MAAFGCDRQGEHVPRHCGQRCGQLRDILHFEHGRLASNSSCSHSSEDTLTPCDTGPPRGTEPGPAPLHTVGPALARVRGRVLGAGSTRRLRMALRQQKGGAVCSAGVRNASQPTSASLPQPVTRRADPCTVGFPAPRTHGAPPTREAQHPCQSVLTGSGPGRTRRTSLS